MFWEGREFTYLIYLTLTEFVQAGRGGGKRGRGRAGFVLEFPLLC